MPFEITGFEQLSMIVIIGVLVAALIFVMAVRSGMDRSRRNLRQRVERASGRQVRTPAEDRAVSVKRRTADSSIAGIDKLVKRVIPRRAALRARLAKTGRDISIGEYALVNLVIIASTAFAVHQFMLIAWLAAILFGMLAGLGLPHVVVSWMIRRRINKFTNLFPDAIDLIVRGLKSGLPVPESIKIVGEEMSDPIGVEFRQVTDSLKLGKPLEDALWDTAKRIDTPEFKFFIVSLSVQQETGGNLTETLDNLADILRKRRQMRGKVKAMSSEARASAMIIGSLPFIMFAIIFVLSNDYVMSLFRDPRGMMMVGAGLTSMVIGILVIAKMVRFEI